MMLMFGTEKERRQCWRRRWSEICVEKQAWQTGASDRLRGWANVICHCPNFSL